MKISRSQLMAGVAGAAGAVLVVGGGGRCGSIPHNLGNRGLLVRL